DETAGGVPAGDGVKRHQSSAAMRRRPRLVEADVARSSNAQDLKVNAPYSANHLLISSAIVLYLAVFDHSIGNMNLVCRNVDMIEKRLLHPAAVALLVRRRHGKVFIQVKSDDPREIQARFFMSPNQLPIKTHRRRARRQT